MDTEKGEACYYCGDMTFISKITITSDRLVITYRCQRCKATEKKVLKKNEEQKSNVFLQPKHGALRTGGY